VDCDTKFPRKRKIAEGFSFDSLYVVRMWVSGRDSESKEPSKDEHAEQLEAFIRPEEVDRRAVSIWEWYLNVKVDFQS